MVDVRKEIEFFDRFEQHNEDYDVLGPYAYQKLLRLFRERVSPRPGMRCIDLGCGSGAFTKRLAAAHPELEVEGMDISPRLIERANSRGGRERYQVGNIMESGLPDCSFDCVIYSAVLHHFPTRQDRLAVVREGLRLLRPGGSLFAFDPYAYSPSMFLYRDPRSPLYSPNGKTDNEVLLSQAMVHDELLSAGFGRIRLQPSGGITFCYIEDSHWRLLLPLYNLYEVLLEATRLERIFGTFLISSACKPG